MKTADFAVAKRPNLAAVDRFPRWASRGLSDLQQTPQRVRQAYLGAPNRAVIALDMTEGGGSD
jgi:hypothetical protein